MWPVLALMMVGDARATRTTFTSTQALKNAVDACAGNRFTGGSLTGVSPVGNCCLPQDSTLSTDIVVGTGGDQEGICADGYTHLQNWDVSQVDSMDELFNRKKQFDQPLNGWDVSKVTNMGYMFQHAFAFNQPLDSWDTGLVTDMSNMFNYALVFDQPLDSWDVSQVTNMYKMFYHARKFNRLLNSWNVRKVTDMLYMFSYAYAYDQEPLCGPHWVFNTMSDKEDMFNGVINGGIATSPCCPAGTFNFPDTVVCSDVTVGCSNMEPQVMKQLLLEKMQNSC